MPTTFRTQIVGQVKSTADPAADFITNVVYHNAATASATTHGDAILALFAAHGPYPNYARLWVKVYDAAAPLHSPPVYAPAPHVGSGVTPGPRQVALCLSFYSGLNIRGQRGRIYIGPWPTASLTEFAGTTDMNDVLALGSGLLHVGAADTVHVIWHKKTATWSNVSNYFVNNRWDTMRSRLPKETNRVHSP